MTYNDYAIRREPKENKLGMVLLLIVMTVLLGWSISRALDIHIQSQDTMLCESAKISGNEEYTKKCQCYYSGSDITCLQ